MHENTTPQNTNTGSLTNRPHVGSGDILTGTGERTAPMQEPAAYVTLDGECGIVSTDQKSWTVRDGFRFSSRAQLEAWLMLNTDEQEATR